MIDAGLNAFSYFSAWINAYVMPKSSWASAYISL